MASSSRVFKGCRALFAASKAATPAPKPSPAAGKKPAAAPAPKRSPTAAASSPKSSPAAAAAPTPAPKRSPAADAATPAAAEKKTKEKKILTKPTGLLKTVPISPALRDFLGVPESARPEALKKIWAYVKLHNLQNPKDKKEIVCDDKLKKIFEGKEKVGMLEVSKLLTPHFVKN